MAKDADIKSLTTLKNDRMVREIQATCAPRQRFLISLLSICDKYELNANKEQLLTSMSHDLPRTPLESRRRTRKFYWSRIRRFAKEFQNPVDNHEALSKFPGLLPESVELAMQIATRKRTRSIFNDAWLNRSPDFIFDLAPRESVIARMFPLFLKAGAISLIMTFLYLKVLPELEKMLEEFAMEQPSVFQWTTQILDFLLATWLLPAALLLMATLLSLPSLVRYFKRWNPFVWKQPMRISKVENRKALAMLTLDGDMTGLNRLKQFKKLHKTLGTPDSAACFIDWQELAAKNLISRREARAIQTADSRPVKAWILRESAAAMGEQYDERGRLFSRSVTTVINFLLGVSVAFIAVSVFSLLIGIISNLS